MRRIISKKNSDKRKQIIIGLVLVFIMLGSVFGIIANSFGQRDSTQKINYNGFEFVNQNEHWFMSVGGMNFVFKYTPNQVEKINSIINPVGNYYNQPLYVFSENEDAKMEIYRNLEQVALRIRPAYLEGREGEENWPVKTCEDNFIIIKESDVIGISQDENCVFISGPQENLTKLADGFLFKVLGIEQ